MENSRRYRTILPQAVDGAREQGKLVAPNALGPSSLMGSGRHFTRSSSASAATPAELGKKRKRVGTRIACNACRQRKARCDGKKPSCGWCLGKGTDCIYADERQRYPTLERPAGAGAQELLELIKSQDEDKALDLIKQLRSNQDPSTLPPAAREGMETGYSRRLLWSACPSVLDMGSRHTIGLSLHSTLESELMCGNPVSYPRPPSLPVFSGEVSDLLRPFGADAVNPRGKTHPPGGQSPSTGTHEVSLLSTPTSHDSSTSRSMSRTEASDKADASDHAQAAHPPYCDQRLRNLDISFWTKVPISSRCAAHIISLSLETDHPLLGTFDPYMFVEDLTQCRYRLSSPFLVDVLLFLASQMYSAIDEEARSFVQPFSEEAEGLWESGLPDSLPNMAALQLLSLAYIGHGKDHCVLTYRNEACDMARRMCLVGVDPSVASRAGDAIPEEMKSPSSYASWGIFNWTVLTSLFYQQPGFKYLESPPVLPLPDPVACHEANKSLTGGPPYMGETFPALCKFWRILHGVTLQYYNRTNNATESPNRHVSLDFVELKYRELLAWLETLPRSLIPSENSPHHVIVFHIWAHAAILDLYRPFLRKHSTDQQRLKTFYSADSTPDAAFNASVKQLKRLVIFYRSQYPSSTYTILWHNALVYLANAVLQDPGNDPEWRFYLYLCLYGYVYLRRSYRLAEAAGRALLSMTLRQGRISPADARNLLREMRDRGQTAGSSSPSPPSGDIRATFMGDLDLAMTNPAQASVENLSHQFEDLALFQEFTNFNAEPSSEQQGDL